MSIVLDRGLIEAHNAARSAALVDDYDSLGRQLDRRGIQIEDLRRKVAAFSVAVPTWGVGRGGTRFARFPIAGEPTNIYEKLQDCAVIQQLATITPRVSPHFPWDKVADYAALRQQAVGLGLAFDAVNSNTFQDQPGQNHSYATGSLSSTVAATRQQAIEHNIECIEIGQKLGSNALTVWIGDGTNFPGQQDLNRSLDRYLDSASRIYAALPAGWRMLIEHKLYEPAFYSTVIADWGTSILAAQSLGPNAQCLVDLGHHAPNTNIEQVVARLHYFGKLGGFHFNDGKYGDDDLDAGSINPHQLFLVFHELAEAERNPRAGYQPAFMIDQSHNVTDPIESLLASAESIVGSYCQAQLVDHETLRAAQNANDTMAAFQILRRAYLTDVTPILAKARMDSGGAVDPLVAFRVSGYRAKVAQTRQHAGTQAGIV